MEKDCTLKTNLSNVMRLNAKLNVVPGSSGTELPIDYENDEHIINRPQINSIELIGDKSSEDLNLQEKMDALTTQEIEKILYL